MKTSCAGKIARIDAAAVRFGAPSAESQTKPHAGSIRAALLERAKELVDIPDRQTAALVLNLDQHALGAAAGSERNGGSWPSELQRILQEVSDDRSEHLARACASMVAAERMSSMNPETTNWSRFRTPLVRRAPRVNELRARGMP